MAGWDREHTTLHRTCDPESADYLINLIAQLDAHWSELDLVLSLRTATTI